MIATKSPFAFCIPAYIAASFPKFRENESKVTEQEVQDTVAEETAEKTAAEETVETASCEASQNAETSEEKTEKKGFTKGKKKDKKEEAMKEKIAELEDRVVRQMAEFENFRKRTEKEKSAMFETGAKSVVEKILPVVDNFERGLATIPEEDKGTPFAEGMTMIYKQLMTELENIGVKPIEAVGKEFDPNLHNAVMHGDDDQYGENIVSEEFQKGYMYRDTVVRYSMVKVVN